MADPYSTPPRISQEAISLQFLRWVSFNVAGCVPSKEAPESWSINVVTEAIVKEVLRYDPDIIALQEYPTGDPAKLLQTFPSYQIMGSTLSHADHVVLLVKKGISARPVLLSTAFDFEIPVVLAELNYKQRKLLVGSVHLAPFESGSVERQMQVEAILKYAKTKDESIPVIFAGDTNMREREDDVMENDLGLLDVWKLSGSPRESKFTWDTVDHTAADNDGDVKGSFNRYYGQATRQYTARYDRIYLCSSHSGHLETVNVNSFQLIANQPLTNAYHFLSDHFGMSTDLSLVWNSR